MIPKIIHYCWYGRGKKDDLTMKCIASWKKYCPDYEIIEWNEDNSDISDSVFASEAYEEKKWAFVSDYWRLKVLDLYGGIYLDTDVEILKNIDLFLYNSAFFGYADDTYIGTGMFGCESGNPICKVFLEYYKNHSFVRMDKTYNDLPNNQIYTAICLKKLGMSLSDNLIEYGNTRIYPSEYFSPFKIKTIGSDKKIYEKDNFDCTGNTYAIHYTVCSWGSEDSQKASITKIIRFILPRKLYFKLKSYVMLKKMNRLDI